MGRLSPVRGAVGVVLIAGLGLHAPSAAQAAGTDAWYASVEGQFGTVEGSLGNALLGDLFSGQVTIFQGASRVDPRGIDDLNGFPAPVGGARAGSRVDLGVGGVAGLKLTPDHVVATAPAASGPASRTYVPVGLPPVFDLGAVTLRSSATWKDLFAAGAPERVVTEVGAETAAISLLDLGAGLGAGLGPVANLLPAQLRGPLIQVQTMRGQGQIATIRNASGTHGLRASGTGGLAAVHVLGGSDQGGVTLGLFNSDTGNAQDTAGTRIWATGEPGGAGCSYVVPDTVRVSVAGTTVGLPISVGQRVQIPGGLGYLDVRFTGQSHCETSADGTYAHATGAGVGISLHLRTPSLPGLPAGDLGTVTLSLPDLDAATVRVPRGGIPADGGTGGTSGTTTGATGTGSTSGAGGTTGTGSTSGTGGTTGTTDGGAGANGGAAAGSGDPTGSGTVAVAGPSAGGLPDTGGVVRWLAPFGLALLLGGHLLARRGLPSWRVPAARPLGAEPPRTRR